jgi:hypothetical protein
MEEIIWEETIVIIKEEPEDFNTINFNDFNIYKTKNSSVIQTRVNQREHGRKIFSCSEIGLEQYKCNQCDFKTDLMIALRKHQKGHEINSKPEEVNFVIFYTCKNCHFETSSVLVLTKHINDKCPSEIDYNKWFGCKKCRYRTRTESLFNQHFATNHETTESGNYYKCELCPFKTKYKKTLATHHQSKQAHPPGLWFKCDQCTYKSHDKSYLKYHKKLQHSTPENIKWYKCTSCRYKTKMLGHLNRHITCKHTVAEEIKWYKCEQCDYKAKQNSNLKRHLLQHANANEIYWYQCDKCSYQTKERHLLKMHVQCKHVKCGSLKLKRFSVQ